MLGVGATPGVWFVPEPQMTAEVVAFRNRLVVAGSALLGEAAANGGDVDRLARIQAAGALRIRDWAQLCVSRYMRNSSEIAELLEAGLGARAPVNALAFVRLCLEPEAKAIPAPAIWLGKSPQSCRAPAARLR